MWLDVLLDQPGVPNYAKLERLLTAGLIKLRYVPDDPWNADTPFALTPSKPAAEELAEVADADDWGGEVGVYTDQKGIGDALGTGRRPCGLLPVWWD